MSKTLAIIGKGTAGCYAAGFFLKNTDWDIHWYYDNSIPPQSVGEGSTPLFPEMLYQNINFVQDDLPLIDGSLKLGVNKINWGTKDFIHKLPNIGYHFNAVKFQNFTFEKLKDHPRLTPINKNIITTDVLADFVMDCSGRPTDFSDFNIAEDIAVNSVYVVQCYWDQCRFNETLAVARPYGWVFGIPLANRCSIGYMYNHNFNTLEEVIEDVKIIFKDFDLTPSNDISSFRFNSYTRKNNFVGNIAYNGNSSFFLEPMEATSIDAMHHIQDTALKLWNNEISLDHANNFYAAVMKEFENIIMLHYFAGSKFDTPFWKMAKEKAIRNMEGAMSNNLFVNLLDSCLTWEPGKDKWFDRTGTYSFGSWWLPSFKQNILGLDIYNKLKQVLGG